VRLATLTDGRTARVVDDGLIPLPGRLVDHLCRAPTSPPSELLPPASPLAAPIARPGKLVCLGLNYADHAAESGQPVPEQPMLFSKASSCVIGPGADVQMPSGDVQLDYEAELAIVIGRPARNVAAESALEFVGGYACFNDVSERIAQMGDGQWFRGKSADTFAPFGPWVVTPDEVPDPHSLSIRCTVNDEVRQDSNTSQMVFKVDEIVAYCSRAFTLEPGDLIATGTPPGVALGSGKWLRPGDTMTVEIEGLGALTNTVVAPAS
jgi:2-keto-4-pentenoate hydratase/2-oxohepta-3-ene-1,7-dioic acid hydratase in catechol pathway